MLVAGIGSRSGPPSEAFSATHFPEVQAQDDPWRHHYEGFVPDQLFRPDRLPSFQAREADEHFSFQSMRDARLTVTNSPNAVHFLAIP
jgi:hypothetical protein